MFRGFYGLYIFRQIEILTKTVLNPRNDSSIKLGATIAQFHATMLDRSLLFHCKKNFSLIYDPTWNSNGITGNSLAMIRIILIAFLK